MAVGDLFYLRLQYSYLGEQMENTFYYEHLTTGGGSGNLGANFVLDILPDIVAVQSTSALYGQIVVINLDDPTDFATTPVSDAGDITGEGTAPFTSWGFIRFSTDRRLRSGGVRIGGVAESSVDDGFAIPTLVTLLDALAVTLNTNVTSAGDVNIYAPRMHTDGNAATDNNPLTVVIDHYDYRRVSTQSSRKFAS